MTAEIAAYLDTLHATLAALAHELHAHPHTPPQAYAVIADMHRQIAGLRCGLHLAPALVTPPVERVRAVGERRNGV